MYNRILMLLLLISVSFASDSRSHLIVSYSDFGPPAMSSGILGSEWWQWNNHGDSDPNSWYDVKIVVYHNISLEEIRNRYPVIPSKKQDYRYLQFADAKSYLHKNIAELQSIEEEWAVGLAIRLKTFLTQLEEGFSE